MPVWYSLSVFVAPEHVRRPISSGTGGSMELGSNLACKAQVSYPDSTVFPHQNIFRLEVSVDIFFVMEGLASEHDSSGVVLALCLAELLLLLEVKGKISASHEVQNEKEVRFSNVCVLEVDYEGGVHGSKSFALVQAKLLRALRFDTLLAHDLHGVQLCKRRRLRPSTRYA